MTEQKNISVWEEGEWNGFPLLDSDERADVCVIGLGGSGLAAITELTKQGTDVVGIDAGSVAGGAAGRNGGLLLAGLSQFYHHAVKLYERDISFKLYERTIDEIKRMSLETPEAINSTGSLRIAYDDKESLDITKHFEELEKDHLPVQRYKGPEGEGIFLPTDAVFNPLLRSRILAKRVMQAGTRLFERTPAIKIESGIVYTPKGTIKCGHIIAAVDGKLGKLFPLLASRVRSVRLQMLATAPYKEIIYTRPVYTRWGYDYWQQLPNGSIALGGCRDIGGDEEYSDDPTPTEVVQSALTKTLRDRLKITSPVTHRWGAIVSYTENGLPIKEEVAKNVWAIGGYSGTGNVIGSLYGREIANRIMNKDI